MAGRLGMRVFSSIIFVIVFHLSPLSEAQNLDGFKLLLEDHVISDIIATANGNYLIAAHSHSKTIKLYNTKTLQVEKSFSIPKEIPTEFKGTGYPNIGEPAKISLLNDRFLSISCYGGYIVHIDIVTDKVSWYGTSASGVPETMFSWTGGYLRSNQIYLHNERLKQIWYINPLTGIVSGPFIFEDSPTDLKDGIYFTVTKFNVPRLIEIHIKDFRTKAIISKIAITDLHKNDTYNFSALLSPDNKYLLVNLYTKMLVYNLKTSDRIFYRAQEAAYPPNIFITNEIAGFGGVMDYDLTFYDILKNKHLGKLNLSNYDREISTNSTHLFVYRSMKLANEKFVGIIGSIPLTDLINNPEEYSVDVFSKFDGKTLEELKLLNQK